MQSVKTDLPFKVSDRSIVVIKTLPVFSATIVRSMCSKIR